MSPITAATALAERVALPDPVLRLAIAGLVGRWNRSLKGDGTAETLAMAASMERAPIAQATATANRQHYEVPTGFFRLVLGPRLKYSSCLYPPGCQSLAEAEELALAETARNAGLADGQRILELGCGWGSLSLWMARRFPRSSILAVSNSATQKAYIDGQAAALGLANLSVVTADMNDFACAGDFERIVSVEMFEHMSSWPRLLTRLRGWLEPHGRVLLHVFSHRTHAYAFDAEDEGDWIGRYFFTGGIMPSHALIRGLAHPFRVEQDWRWSGLHYARTADHWLANLDRQRRHVLAALEPTYGGDARLWLRRWRLFFLATSGLFGHDEGAAWGISQYRLAPV